MSDPNLAALLGGTSVRAAFCAVGIDLKSGQKISLIDAASEVAFSVDGASRTFKGQDETFGTLANIDAIEEGVATNSPRLTLGLNLPEGSGLATLSLPSNKGSTVRLWLGAVDTVTGTAYAALEFRGRLDRTSKTAQRSSGFVQVFSSSFLDQLFVEDEGFRMNDASHRAIRPSEAGMVYTPRVNQKLPWGVESISPGPALGGFTGGGFGGGFGGGGGRFRNGGGAI